MKPSEQFRAATAEPVNFEREDFGANRRFHLSFISELGLGDEAVSASSIEQAALRLMRSRGIREIFVLKRFVANPRETVEINRKFSWDGTYA
jgi:hypothetical protein